MKQLCSRSTTARSENMGEMGLLLMNKIQLEYVEWNLRNI